MQVRVGTDIVAVARIRRLVDDRGDAFLDKWFSPAEVAYCRAKAYPERHLAARLAAKEAIFKAVGGDAGGPVPWREIEVLSGVSGAPSVRLDGATAAHASRHGGAAVELSLSHCDEYATATAVMLVEP